MLNSYVTFFNIRGFYPCPEILPNFAPTLQTFFENVFFNYCGGPYFVFSEPEKRTK